MSLPPFLQEPSWVPKPKPKPKPAAAGRPGDVLIKAIDRASGNSPARRARTPGTAENDVVRGERVFAKGSRQMALYEEFVRALRSDSEVTGDRGVLARERAIAAIRSGRTEGVIGYIDVRRAEIEAALHKNEVDRYKDFRRADLEARKQQGLTPEERNASFEGLETTLTEKVLAAGIREGANLIPGGRVAGAFGLGDKMYEVATGREKGPESAAVSRWLAESQPGIANDNDFELIARGFNVMLNSPASFGRAAAAGDSRQSSELGLVGLGEEAVNMLPAFISPGGAAAKAGDVAVKSVGFLGKAKAFSTVMARALATDAPNYAFMVKDSGGVAPAVQNFKASVAAGFRADASPAEFFNSLAMAFALVGGAVHLGGKSLGAVRSGLQSVLGRQDADAVVRAATSGDEADISVVAEKLASDREPVGEAPGLAVDDLGSERVDVGGVGARTVADTEVGAAALVVKEPLEKAPYIRSEGPDPEVPGLVYEHGPFWVYENESRAGGGNKNYQVFESGATSSKEVMTADSLDRAKSWVDEKISSGYDSPFGREKPKPAVDPVTQPATQKPGPKAGAKVGGVASASAGAVVADVGPKPAGVVDSSKSLKGSKKRGPIPASADDFDGAVEIVKRVKGKNPDSIVGVRMGDNYEFIGKDAKVVADAIGVQTELRSAPNGGTYRAVTVPFGDVGVARTALSQAGANLVLSDVKPGRKGGSRVAAPDLFGQVEPKGVFGGLKSMASELKQLSDESGSIWAAEKRTGGKKSGAAYLPKLKREARDIITKHARGILESASISRDEFVAGFSDWLADFGGVAVRRALASELFDEWELSSRAGSESGAVPVSKVVSSEPGSMKPDSSEPVVDPVSSKPGPEGDATGLARHYEDAERKARGLLANPGEGVSPEALADIGQYLYEADRGHAKVIVKEALATGKLPASEADVAQVAAYKRDLRNQWNALLDKAHNNQGDLMYDDSGKLVSDGMDDLEAEIGDVELASGIFRNKWHRFGQAMQVGFGTDWSYAAIKKVAETRYRGAVPGDIDAQLKSYVKAYQKSEGARANLQSQLNDVTAALDELRNQVKPGIDPSKRRAAALRGLKQLGYEISDGFVNAGGGFKSKKTGAVRVPGPNPGAAKHIRDLVMSHLETGEYSTLDAAIDDVVALVPNLTRDLVYDAVSPQHYKLRMENDSLQREVVKLMDELGRRGRYRVARNAEKAAMVAMEAMNLAKASSASFDLSAPFIQGLAIGITHPGIWLKAWAPMIKAGFTPKYADAHSSAIRLDVDFGRSQRDGLQLSDVRAKLGTQEEMFKSAWIERLSQVEKGGANPFVGLAKILKRSEFAFSVFMNDIRFALYKKLVALNPNDVTYGKEMARLVNILGGRGHGKFFDESLSSPLALQTVFAPRWSGSLVQLTALPVTSLSSKSRKAQVRTYTEVGKLALAFVAVKETAKFLGWDVDEDLRSQRVGTLTAPNGFQINLLNRLTEPFRVATQLLQGRITIAGDYVAPDSGTALGIGDLIEQKFAPGPRMIEQLVTGKRRDAVSGSSEQGDWLQMAADIYAPMSAWSIIQKASSPNAGDMEKGMSWLDLLGVQHDVKPTPYEKRKRKSAKKIVGEGPEWIGAGVKNRTALSKKRMESVGGSLKGILSGE